MIGWQRERHFYGGFMLNHPGQEYILRTLFYHYLTCKDLATRTPPGSGGCGLGLRFLAWQPDPGRPYPQKTLTAITSLEVLLYIAGSESNTGRVRCLKSNGKVFGAQARSSGPWKHRPGRSERLNRLTPGGGSRSLRMAPARNLNARS